jgi:hypothetical protein
MTNKEYITKSLSKFEVSTDDVDLIILENQLDGSANADIKTSKQAICKSIGTWIPIYSSIAEGGVSKSWNFDAIKLYYSSLCRELGIDDSSAPTVRDRSNIW